MKGKRICYKPLLRTIGQLLRSLEIAEFDLTITGDLFVIHPHRSAADSPWYRLHRYIVKATTRRSDKAASEYRYTLAELEAMDLRYRRLAVDGTQVPDRRSLPQILRVTGAYVDEKRGELLSLSKRESSFVIAYLTSAGEKRVEDLLYLDVDGLFVRELGLRRGQELSAPEQGAETGCTPAISENVNA